MKVSLLTSNQRFRSEIDLVNLLFENGLELLHLKKRKFTKSKTKEYLNSVSKNHHNKIILHKHYWLAAKYKLKGIHLGRTERRSPLKTAIKIFFLKLYHPKLQVTTSFHSLQSAQEDVKNYNHVILSPIFDSISKRNYSPAFSERQLISLFEKTKHNYYALGGVDEAHVSMAKNLGFKGILLYGSIWNAGDEKLKKFKSIVALAKGEKKHIPEVKLKPVKIKI